MRALLIGTGPGCREVPSYALDAADLVVGINQSSRLYPGRVSVAAFFDEAMLSEVLQAPREVWTAQDRLGAARLRFPGAEAIAALGCVEAALALPRRLRGAIPTMEGAAVTAARRGYAEIELWGAPMAGGPRPERWPWERERLALLTRYLRDRYGARLRRQGCARAAPDLAPACAPPRAPSR